MFAAASGDVPSVEALITNGADVSAPGVHTRPHGDDVCGRWRGKPEWRASMATIRATRPKALALLEKLGAKNNHKCVSC
jgi:hypothetical protein